MCLDQCENHTRVQSKSIVFPSYVSDSELSDDLRTAAQKLGPYAATSLAVFVDLGLSDKEIGRYFGLPSSRIRQLCRTWQIAACH